MSSATPFFREAGTGPSVVCLHSNASSSAQWRGLVEMLQSGHQVLAPDLYGSGKSVDWPSDREIALADEVSFIAPVLEKAGDSFALVGHSYGGAVALRAAVAHPGRVRALVLYEPTLFSLVESAPAPVGSVEGIRQAVAAAAAALDAGDRDTAAMRFIDFWMGDGSWDATPAARKGPIVESIVNVRRWAHALFTEACTLEHFAQLEMPVLYLTGGRSPESGKAVARALRPVLRNVSFAEVPSWGHMAPITHAEEVNARIAAFLARP